VVVEKNGEKSQKEIERHAKEWIDINSAKWKSWLEAARKSAL
jgi:glycine betaine/proline transport system substrate-binding protein